MKTRIRLLTLGLAMVISANSFAQQTDPTLTGAVAAQTEMLKKRDS